MMLITVVDVSMRALLGKPLKGSFDLVESMIVLVVFCGLPTCFLHEKQITVDLLDHIVSPRVVGWLRLVGSLSSFAFLTILGWNTLLPAMEAHQFGDQKPDFPIYLFVLWIIIIGGISASVLMTVVVIIRNWSMLAQRPGNP
jgi:TRAP-type C4-dicarboxylate transport system permease small subunit